MFKIFFNQYNVSSFGNCSSKKVLMIANLSYCFTLVKANELQKVQVLLLYIPLVTGIIQFVNISVSKTALNYLHELRFRFLWESCTLKRITRRWWNYPKFTERKSKMAKELCISTFSHRVSKIIVDFESCLTLNAALCDNNEAANFCRKERHHKCGRVYFVYGRSPFTCKKQLFVTNVKVFQPLSVVEKRFPLDVAGFLNPISMRKPFTNVGGFLNPLWQSSWNHWQVPNFFSFKNLCIT